VIGKGGSAWSGLGSLVGRCHVEDNYLRRRITLIEFLKKKRWEGADWIHLAQHADI
jgi:hypothetical protein